MSLGRPLRIVIVGQSVGFFVRPPRSAPGPANYGELLEHRLRQRGIHADVRNSARWFLLAHEGFQQIEALVMNHTPDVVVTNFAMGECQPKLIPTRLLRWMFTWRPPGGWLSRVTRGTLLVPLNLLYTRIAPPIIRIVPTPHRLSPRRFRFEMSRFVGIIRKERRALVLLLGANPAGHRLEATLPGTDARSQRYNEILRSIASEHSDVELIDCRSMVLDAGIDHVMPDGIHFNEAGHEMVADHLEERVLAWLQRQPDLLKS